MEDLVKLLVSVPITTQEEFITEASNDSVRKCAWSIKYFGIAYKNSSGVHYLLCGQIYHKFPIQSLDEWANGLQSEEFQGKFEHCVAISLDLSGNERPRIRLIDFK